MNIKYKIISADETEHSIVVRFYTDVITEESLAIPNPDTGEIRAADGSFPHCRTDYNITLFDVPILTGDAFEEFIMHHAPNRWFELKEKIADASVDTSVTSMESMVGQERDVVPPPE